MSIYGKIGLSICILILGVPLVMFFAVLTYGVIFIPVAGFIMLAPFGLLHYVMWGRFMSKKLGDPESSMSMDHDAGQD